MKVTAITRAVLAFRREERRLKAAGYVLREIVAPHTSGRDRVIVDVQIACDRKHVWVKLEDPPRQ